MTTLVLVDARLKPGCLQDALSFLAERLPETREYPGCRGIDAYVADDGANLVLVETWDSEARFDAYLQWRQESGSFATFSDYVKGEPQIRRYVSAEV